MKEIHTTVTDETYNKLFSIAKEKGINVSELIEEIILKETKTISKKDAIDLYNKTH